MSVVQDLVALIRDLDRGAESQGHNQLEYLEVMRWNQGGLEGGNSDEKATALVRSLAREKLGTFPLEEIGAAVLTHIDSEGPAS